MFRVKEQKAMRHYSCIRNTWQNLYADRPSSHSMQRRKLTMIISPASLKEAPNIRHEVIWNHSPAADAMIPVERHKCAKWSVDSLCEAALYVAGITWMLPRVLWESLGLSKKCWRVYGTLIVCTQDWLRLVWLDRFESVGSDPARFILV